MSVGVCVVGLASEVCVRVLKVRGEGGCVKCGVEWTECIG